MTETSDIRVAGLHVELCDRPLGVEARTPALGWRLESGRCGAAQSAWRVCVASEPGRLKAGDPDLWDSGWTDNQTQTGVRYAGLPLTSRQQCWWQVIVRDDFGQTSLPSAISRWEMGLLHLDDWHARWLAVEDEIGAEDRAAGLHWIWPEPGKGNPDCYFRRAFESGAETMTLLAGARHPLVAVLLDGAPIPLPTWTPTPFGERPVLELPPIALAPGRHVLEARVDAAAPTYRARAGDGFCALVRLYDGRAHRRLTTAEGWETSPDGLEWKRATATPCDWQPFPPRPARLFRQRFDLAAAPRTARLYIAALGGALPHINGMPADDARLQAEPTDFRHRALYRAIDVTSLLRAGENCLAVHGADGWYASYLAPGGRFALGPAPPRFIAQLEWELADGTKGTLGTGEDWRATGSPIRSSEIYDGEIHDARLALPGWDGPGFDDADWDKARVAPTPPSVLAAQIQPPVRQVMTLPARRIEQKGPRRFLCDFGQNFAGVCQLTLEEPAGTEVVLRHGEILDARGEIDQRNLRSAKATDRYICRGGGETWSPAFTYHGFRYVEVDGISALPLNAIEGQVLSSDLPVAARFETGNALLNHLWQNVVWTQRSNLVGIFTDDPQRDERLGWLGDAAIFADAAAFIMDIGAVSRRFLADARDAQSPAGAFPVAIPWNGPVGDAPSPGWSDGAVFLTWLCWRRYGDTGIIEENWPAIRRYLALVQANNPSGVWDRERGYDFGDWLGFDARSPGEATTPKDLVATAIWARAVRCAADMATAIGRPGEAEEYHALHDKIGAAFRARFLAPDGLVGNGSQAGYILALAADIIPLVERKAAQLRLAADIERRGGLLATGLQGTPHALDALADGGRGDLAVDLLLRTEIPSWGYMITRGATTIWERWDSDTDDPDVQAHMNSYNQITLGAVGGFLMRRVAGIDAAAPGFEVVRVAPLLDPRFERCTAEYDSVRGRISVRWERSASDLTLAVSIPAGCRGEVFLPKGRMMEGGRPVAACSDIVVCDAPTGCVAEIASGDYLFEVTL